MRIRDFIPLLLLLCISGFSYSQEFLEYWGQLPISYSANSYALGNCSICLEQGPAALLINPALIASGKGWNFAINGKIDKCDELRSFPAYSFFDNFIGYQTYVTNTNFYNFFSGGVIKNIDYNENKISFGFGVFPYLDFNYRYEEQVRNRDNPEPIKVAINTLERAGNIYSYSFGIAENFGKNFAIGLSYNSLEGDLNYLKSVVATPQGRDELGSTIFEDKIEQEQYQFSGHSFSFGISLFTKRVEGGIILRTKADIGDYFIWKSNDELIDYGEFKMKLPAIMGLGIKYKPRSGTFTNFYLDIKKIFWSEFTNSLQPLTEFYDIIVFSIGVEHIFDSGIPFRFGVFNYPSYIEKGLGTTGFSLGTAVRISNNMRFDIGYQLRKRTYRYEDSFPDGAYVAFFDNNPPEDREYKDKIDEVVNSINITYSFSY